MDYIDRLRRSGKPMREAIIEGGCTRARPILMTASTTILAVLTMAFGLGTGAEVIQPMAIVVFGGMLYATVMTLFVVPAIYDLFLRRKTDTVMELAQGSPLDQEDEMKGYHIDKPSEEDTEEEEEDDSKPSAKKSPGFLGSLSAILHREEEEDDDDEEEDEDEEEDDASPHFRLFRRLRSLREEDEDDEEEDDEDYYGLKERHRRNHETLIDEETRRRVLQIPTEDNTEISDKADRNNEK